MLGILDLEDDLLQFIFALLPITEAMRLRAVCKKFDSQFVEEYLWRQFSMSLGVLPSAIESVQNWKQYLKDEWAVRHLTSKQ